MNEITDTSPKSATPLGVHSAAREALASAERRQAIAGVLDYLDRHRGELRTPRSGCVTVKDPQALARILDHHDARRNAAVPLALLVGSSGIVR